MAKIRVSKYVVGALICWCSAMSQTALAASCTSTGAIPPSNKTVSATLDGASSVSSCTAMVKDNLEHKNSLTAFGMDWVLLVKDANNGVAGTASNGATAGALVITKTGSGDNLAGSWLIDNTKTGIYNTFVIGLKPDGGFAYWLVDGLSGTYSALSHGLSHANLYGKVGGVPDVPLPAAAWLFGSALCGLVVVSRRKKLA